MNQIRWPGFAVLESQNDRDRPPTISGETDVMCTSCVNFVCDMIFLFYKIIALVNLTYGRDDRTDNTRVVNVCSSSSRQTVFSLKIFVHLLLDMLNVPFC